MRCRNHAQSADCVNCIRLKRIRKWQPAEQTTVRGQNCNGAKISEQVHNMHGCFASENFRSCRQHKNKALQRLPTTRMRSSRHGLRDGWTLRKPHPLRIGSGGQSSFTDDWHLPTTDAWQPRHLARSAKTKAVKKSQNFKNILQHAR